MHSRDYLKVTAEIAAAIDVKAMETLATELYKTMGRIYVIGLGGSMANAIHFAADLRKLCHLEAHTVNYAEFTARANDEGMHTVFTGWLRDLTNRDTVFVLSVGGGTDEVSTGITAAVKYARDKGAKVLGIVGPDGGSTARMATCCVKIPAPLEAITPHTEAFQAVVWHALVSHPLLQRTKAKW